MMLVRAGVSLAEITSSVSALINSRVPKSPVKSIQRGVVSLQSSGIFSVSVTVSSVNMAKARLSLVGGGTYVVNNSADVRPVRARLLNSTTIEVIGGGSSGGHASWELVEDV